MSSDGLDGTERYDEEDPLGPHVTVLRESACARLRGQGEVAALNQLADVPTVRGD